MSTTLDHEHAVLARLLDGVAGNAHTPDGCELCDRLDIRRTLHGLAEQIRAATSKPPINNKPHGHPPNSPRPTPKPGSTPPRPPSPPGKGR